ncbi:hypothetical protein F2Q69_00005424 [Brassica cretica]|uniref:Uncharacterized protein n=1 Tax=Brassica cretica TaxID=69181 RepID=A0A8S9NMX2_BRACR|nr:hypothetical protein F2Q69_00005424 [Brassica cretica]
MKIKTGRQEPAGNKGEHDDEPLTPTARLFTAPEFNCYITACGDWFKEQDQTRCVYRRIRANFA